jgi:hydroxypyruvate isomerase
VTPIWSAHISWLFGERPYLERVGAARRAGFHHIETAWPGREDREGLPGALAEHEVELALLNCCAGDVANGERGFLNDPARRDEAERAFTAAVELAQRVGTRNLNLLVGRALPGESLARQREALASALSAFGQEAAARDVRILLEPINSIENPGYLAPTPESAVRLIEESDAGTDAFGLLLDVYHVACEGDDPLAAIDVYGDMIGHVQLADYPGRGQPGTGSLEIWEILARLDAVGYTGAVGLEYEPLGSTESSLAFLRDGRAPVGF